MTAEKTFTQDELNAIVSKRLAEQKISLSKEIAEKETALNEREKKITVKEKLKANGLSEDLADIIKFDADNADALDDTINSLSDMMKQGQGNNAGAFKPLSEPLPKGDAEKPFKDDLRGAFGLK